MHLAGAKVEVLLPASPMSRKPATTTNLHWGSLLMWILATASALALAWFVLVLMYLVGWVSPFTELPVALQLALIIVTGLSFGSAVAALQSPAIAGQVQWARHWFFGTVLGWGMAAGLLWAEYLILGGAHFSIKVETVSVTLLLVGLSTGAVIGLSQWLFVRRWGTVSPWWILVSAVSWAVSALLAYALSAIQDFGMFTYLALVLLTGMLTDFITGLVLYVLCASSPPRPPQHR